VNVVSGRGPDTSSEVGEDEASEVVVATRFRLARNVDGHWFPGRASSQALSEIAKQVRRSIRQSGDRIWIAHRLSDLSAGDRARLSVDRWLPLPTAGCVSETWVLLEDGGAGGTILVNEEDHLRIQCVVSGWDLGVPRESVESTERALSRDFRFAFCGDRWGYLTASPGNLGTGMRVSALLHLVALGATGERDRILSAARSLDIAIRGLHGEGSDPDGDLFQVSNAISYGRSEAALRDRVSSVVLHLVSEELRARRRLAADRGLWESSVRRAVSALGREELSASVALAILSALRLGTVCGSAAALDKGRFAEAIRLLDVAVLPDDRRRASRLRALCA